MQKMHLGHKNMTDADKTKMKAMHTSMQAAKKAIDSGDYNAFHAAVVGNVKAEAITQDQFNVIVQASKILNDAGIMGRKMN
jgi:hypothetical protein